jgi:16S rRNA (cytosine967-C5)-methyltransferase
MSVARARSIAYEVLHRVEAEGAYASDLLHAALKEDVKPQDSALATELTLGVLRRRRVLDFLLEPRLKKRVERLDLAVALALRMGIYQLRFLERIPARAAVNESVELVKRARKGSAAALVNAVLRRAGADAQRKAPLESLLPAGLAPAERLGILHSHPTWMVERWLARWGEERTAALLEANNRTPRLSGVVHDSVRRDEVMAALKAAGLRTRAGSLLRDAFAVSGGSPARTAAFRSGAISIQDEASQAVPLLLGARAGDRVLDLCAAPGGKTAALARAAGRRGFVVAADRHAHRLRAMQEQFARLGLERVAAVELDAEKALPFGVGFARILVDAPCSGTGTLGRHPEIRWRLRAEQLDELHRLQVTLLRQALERLEPGGRLVYSTCSMEREENEDVVEEALGSAASVRQLRAAEAAAALEPHLAAGVDAARLFDAHGNFRTSPAEFETDGFFAAVLQSTN